MEEHFTFLTFRPQCDYRMLTKKILGTVTESKFSYSDF